MAAKASENGTQGGRKEERRERAREHHKSARQEEKGDKEREAEKAKPSTRQDCFADRWRPRLHMLDRNSVS